MLRLGAQIPQHGRLLPLLRYSAWTNRHPPRRDLLFRGAGNNPFGGEWLETDDGQYLRKSAIVRAFVRSHDDPEPSVARPPGFTKTDRPYNA